MTSTIAMVMLASQRRGPRPVYDCGEHRARRSLLLTAVAAVLTISTLLAPRGAAQAAVAVSPSWGLVPSGLVVGQEFRLLLVTSRSRKAAPTSLAPYDALVQRTVEGRGHAALRAHSSHFKALASTASVDARDHTLTTHTQQDKGVPIYWVAGDKVADDYMDFYDGGWDSNAPRSEAGESLTNVEVWTASDSDGTRGGSLGSNRVTTGLPGSQGKELASTRRSNQNDFPLYGLSGVFRIAATLNAVDPSVAEGRSGTMSDLVFTVALSQSLNSAVTVEFADALSGTALSGVDYEAITGGTLTFPAGVTSQTVTVTVKGDDSDEPDETVVLELSNAVGAELEGGGATLRAAGTIENDDAPAAGEVPATWSLAPPGLLPGARFRLLLVTSTPRNARAGKIDTYDKHVRDAAAGGRSALRPFAPSFRALASTEDVDARDNTVTTYAPGAPGVPVYWVGGAQVADDYADLYDGGWDSNEPRDENGEVAAANVAVFTGSGSDGTKDGELHPGRDAADVRTGSPGVAGAELYGGLRGSTIPAHLYGLSGVFTLVAAPTPTLQPASAAARGTRLTLTYGADMDAEALPDPGDFTVKADGTPVAVAGVSAAGREVVLELASRVAVGASVVASYAAGAVPLRSAVGVPAGGFADRAVANESQPLLSVSTPSAREGAAGTTAQLEFAISLDAASGSEVTVDWADSAAGTATSGDDYEALAGGTLTFSTGETAKTVRVTVNGDGDAEERETVVLELSNAVGAELEGGGATLRAAGTIENDDAPAAGEVPATWSLAPPGLLPGARFRLLLVTSTPRNARAGKIGTYDKHVRDAAAGGRSALRPFAPSFRALASTEDVDARDNTVTTYAPGAPGVPVYWVGGAQVADDYADLYDGGWDSNEPRDENGEVAAANVAVFTGSGSDGTKDGELHPGRDAADVRTGSPGVAGAELYGGLRGSTIPAHLYGLSGVFTLVAAPTPTLQPASAAARGTRLTLTYGADMDAEALPDPGDFTVKADGTPVAVAGVSAAGREVVLELASRVAVGASVVASYAAGAVPLRSAVGVPAGGFADRAVANESQPLLSVSTPSAREGAAGTTAQLEFAISLDAASGSEVTVDWADSAAGTATSGDDYEALAGGTLTFSTGETAKTVRVTVNGDGDAEERETVVLELSNAVGAELEGGGATLRAAGTIENDDVPVGGEVPATWSLAPPGLPPGARFRLLLVTSTPRNARAGKIGTYDKHVRDAAAGGRSALRPFAPSFRALASTEDVDARDNTVTTYAPGAPGVPVYWVGGAQVADDYADLYDGGWDSNEPRDENGEVAAANVAVFTGSGSDGTKDGELHPGRDAADVRTGSPGVAGAELYGGLRGSTIPAHLYGLSGVFTLVAAPTPTLQPASAAARGTRLTLTYGADMDAEALPDPGDFTVKADGTPVAVAGVSAAGREVVLELASRVAVGASVVASYAAGAVPLRSAVGVPAGGFADRAVANESQPLLSVSTPSAREGAAGTTAQLEFAISLDAASGSEVTVDWADSAAGTATSGDDYEALAGGTLTFSTGETAKTVRVTVNGDGDAEERETVVLELSNAVGAELEGGGATLRAAGTIENDDVPVGGEVPATWSLAPPGLPPGARFRLLLVTSTPRNARAGKIGTYDKHVRDAAAGGRSALRPFAPSFRALASTEDVDARDNTVTTYAPGAPGVPVYWVGGAQVADDYADLYDGGWDSNEPRDENGEVAAANVAVFTGSGSDGTKDGELHPGRDAADVRTGSPGVAGAELYGGLRGSTIPAHLYGLSGVFTLVAAPTPTLQPASAAARGTRLTLTYGADMDAEALPDPWDFTVEVDGSRAIVAGVSAAGREVVLELASRVAVGASVVASYAAGAVPLRSAVGVPAGGFADLAVANETQLLLSVSSPMAREGPAGTTAQLEFAISLDAASGSEVTVDWADSAAGTAMSGVDYEALVGGTLTLPAGVTSRTVAVTVRGDNLYEPDETVVLELSNAVGADLAGGGATLQVAGTIKDDDVPVAGEVLATWGLAPPGLLPGAQFRLLLVTSTPRNASAGDIDTYNQHVRDAAAGGRLALRSFAPSFRVLASTEDVDARDNTVTAYTAGAPGVPVYWVGGAKVADDYADLYDGGWDSNKPRDENGDLVSAGVAVFTGSGSDGLKAPVGLHLGHTEDDVRTGSPGVAGAELSDKLLGSTKMAPLYGLSGVFTLAASPASRLDWVSAIVNWTELTLTYPAALDPHFTPAPDDFTMTVDGTERPVQSVSVSGPRLTLTLFDAVPIGAGVTLTYSAGGAELRSLLGALVASFTDSPVENTTQRTLSVSAMRIAEGDSGDAHSLDFEVTLRPPAAEVVTIDYADVSADEGTAISDTDYLALPPGRLTFAPGESSQAVRVTVVGDDESEPEETVVLRFSRAINAVLDPPGETLDVAGTIGDDDTVVPVPVAGEVPATWGQAPPGLLPGAQFRLLLVTSTPRNARAGKIDAYDKHVRDAAAGGRLALRSFAPSFRVLASTEDVDARDNTVTAYTAGAPGVPVYWVGGAKVADDYADLYDGGWDSNEPRDENGEVAAANIAVFTGSGSDGTKDGELHLGHDAANVRTGSPGVAGAELGGGLSSSTSPAHLYGLSGVFTLVAAPTSRLNWVSAIVNWTELTLTYPAALDPHFTPAPDDFTMTVDGTERPVQSVSVSGPRLTLTLFDAVPVGAGVTLTYSAGGAELRSLLGALVASFTDSPVENTTQRTLSVSAMRIAEGDSGDAHSLDFEVTLRPPAAEVVTIDYADVSADEGTASSGIDYLALPPGRLMFAPGESSQVVRVTVVGDDESEPEETVVLRFSRAINAVLDPLGETLDAAGAIGNDDIPMLQVLSTWGLVPSEVSVGASFRLLFVTSSLTSGTFSQIKRYDSSVRGAASNGRAAIRPYADHIWALVSTSNASARENTVTDFTTADSGVPIFWLNGSRAATDYQGFYDGAWDSNSPTDETGADAPQVVEVFTGSHWDGTRDPGGHYMGGPQSEQIRIGKPRTAGAEIASSDTEDAGASKPIYGLSGVFTVVAAGEARLPLVLARAEDDLVTLTFGGRLDFDSMPAPGDFTVTVAGDPRAVSQVGISGSQAVLTLASELTLGEAVTVSYTAGENPLRSAIGAHVAPLAGVAVQNFTKRKLRIGKTSSIEGDPLHFVATLVPASSETVTVEFRTAGGTATEGMDFGQAAGTLTFAPGETSASFTVLTAQDDLDEPNETVAVILSGATNFEFPDRLTQVTVFGTILDDDETVPVHVPPHWELVPPYLADGDSFRLLFVTSEPTDVEAGSIALHDRHVIEAVAAGDFAARVFSEFFWILASAEGIDARDYTNTTYTPLDAGVPIYWLGGDRVADDYRDFYDGAWASNSPTNEFGKSVAADVEVFTGTTSAGTKQPDGRYLGTQAQGAVSLGRPGEKGKELDAGVRKPKTHERALYGLSGVFIVDSGATVPESPHQAMLEVSPGAVPEGTESFPVVVSMRLTRPVRTDQDWSLTVRDDTARTPEDFSAAPRVLTLTVAAGESSAEGTFEISAMAESGGEPECAEAVLVRAVRVTDSDRAEASTRLMITDPSADEAICGPPAEGPSVALAPTGAPNPPESPAEPPSEMPAAEPPERLGTPARLAIWTDRSVYAQGQQVRLLRSVDAMGDAALYAFFYYLEDVSTGARLYFAPALRSTTLEPEIVDQFGMRDGAFRPGGFEFAARDLFWAGAAPPPGSWQFVAEVRSSDAQRIVKVSHAKFVVAAEPPAEIGSPGGPVELEGDETWTKDAVYKLRGTVRVASGVTLAIEAGTVIQALGPEAGIVVERGGRIEVRGTRREPVVMTCDAPVGFREPGCWGGLTVLGDAPVHRAGGAARPYSDESRRDYGGEAADGSSGTLTYLRVEFAGAGNPSGGPPGPALGLYGVGSGTRIEFVQSRAGLGDGIAIRGGTVNCRYCVSSGSAEDLLDWSQGWQGTAQHLFLRQGASGRHGIHARGPAGSSVPSRLPAVFNATLVGGAGLQPPAAAGSGLHLSHGGALTAGNWVVIGFPGMAVHAGVTEGRWVGTGEGLRNVMLHENGGFRNALQISTDIRRHVIFRAEDPLLLNDRYEPNPDPRPGRWSAALHERRAAAPPALRGPWDDAPYAGAFGSWIWTEEWTFFGSESELRLARLPVLTVEESSAGEGGTVEFAVRLEPASEQEVTVRYRTRSDSAAQDADFAEASGTLRFPPGETVRTITVATIDDAIPEEAESFQLLLAAPNNAELAGRTGTLKRTGTIFASDLPSVPVPLTWPLVPPDLAPGDSFRLLFVSSSGRDASSYGIAEYDDHVREAAAQGRPALRPYSEQFRALASTAEVAARLHTMTAHEADTDDAGVPIYWVGGGRVADDYRDFYDGAWTANAPTDEFGAVLSEAVEVFTGSASDGSPHPGGRYLGAPGFAAVQVGRPGAPGFELDAGSVSAKGSGLRLYGLSSVLTLASVPARQLEPVSATVDTVHLTLTYAQILAATTPPQPGDFRVTVSGEERLIADVILDGADVRLRLAAPIGEGEKVAVSYLTSPGSPGRLRAASGVLVEFLTDHPVSNATALSLSVTEPSIPEGDAGGVSILKFEVLLNAPARIDVTVRYSDARTGTAMSGVDYEVLPAGTLTFSPGQVARSVDVRVVGDDLTEGVETVVLRLDGASGAKLPGTAPAAKATGRILGDDIPLVPVQSTWPLVPEGLVVGDRFRLLFVTSVGRDAIAPDLSSYDEHIQAVAQSGRGAVRPFGIHFRILASSAGADARDHTLTWYGESGRGVPIYWLAGRRVADDYPDFYDGDWDSNTPLDEFGRNVAGNPQVFTGTESDGTKHLNGWHIGSKFAAVLFGQPAVNGAELSSGKTGLKSLEFSFYGLSDVFVVAPPSGRPVLPVASSVSGDKLILAYEDFLDADAVPNVADFTVSAGGAPRTVAGVTVSGAEVVLQLARRVVVGEPVTVSYTPGQVSFQTALGTLASPLSEHPVANETPLELSVAVQPVPEGPPGATVSLQFTVTLPLPSDQAVTVRYADSETGTAMPGSDYEPLPEGTLVFEPGEVVKTVTVAVNGDDADEDTETVVLRLSGATNAALAGGATVEVAGHIWNDDIQPIEVPASWGLVPEGLEVGASFRLLFVTSDARDALASDIAVYDEHARAAAMSGRSALRPYSGHFQALGSTREVDALDHTVSNYSQAVRGVPIYWVSGSRVADDYADFYDGDWGSSDPTDESGSAVDGLVEVFTGSAADGTKDESSRYLGTQRFTGVRIGRPGRSGQELDSGRLMRRNRELGLYGLSGVFIVIPASASSLAPTSVTVAGADLTLVWGQPLDADAVPVPEDFLVYVQGGIRGVSRVRVAGSEVTLALTGPVKAGEEVEVTYEAGATPLRSAAGVPSAEFFEQPVTNTTPPLLLISEPSVLEGGAGAASVLEFDVSLEAPSARRVTVNYSDSLEGTAAAGSDYEAVRGGQLVFEPGQRAQVISVRVLGDELEEPGETVVLRLSAPVNAALAGLGDNFLASGMILNDDVPTVDVPASWALVPQGVEPGDAFRLLFVTSLRRDASPESVAEYDQHVRSSVAAGQAAVRPYSSAFRVLGSTGLVDARDHTATAFDEGSPGWPIFWLGGDKVADDYRDFYDGSWDSNELRDEFGTAAGGNVEVFTGSASDGTKDPAGRYFGTRELNVVRVGRPREPGMELAADSLRRKVRALPFYGLSVIFQVSAAGDVAPVPHSAAVDRDRLTLDFADAMDPDSVSAAEAFAVAVGGERQLVVEVEVDASRVTLTLAGEVAAGAAATVSYTAGENPLRSIAGAHVPSLTEMPVVNVTQPLISLGYAAAVEGSPLRFAIRLSAPSAQTVTVRYRAVSEVAAPDTDFVAASGTLTFLPGEVIQVVLIATFDDAEGEAEEAVALVLDGVLNARLPGGNAEAAAIGRIIDNDATAPVLVPPTWDAVPDGLPDGAPFRLLFVTSQGADASSQSMGDYDRHVRESASGLDSRMRMFVGYVRALASTASVDARDHTGTQPTRDGPGVPIYWLAGGRVADDYADLYDGAWDSNEARDESGNALASGSAVFTGSARDGTKSPAGRHLGASQRAGIDTGRPGKAGDELDSGEPRLPGAGLPLYGLSGVFMIDANATLADPAAGLALSPPGVRAASESVRASAVPSAPAEAGSEARRDSSAERGTAGRPDGFAAALGTPARFSIWTDLTDYSPGQQVSLFRSIDPRSDRADYASFYYLENIRTGQRLYFAPGAGATALREEVVDQFGNADGAFLAGRLPRAEKELAWSGPISEAGSWQFVAELRDSGSGRVVKTAHAKFAVLAGEPVYVGGAGSAGIAAADQFWTSDRLYKLRGPLRIERGAALVIEAGTQVHGLGPEAGIIVGPGARIEARGTRRQPVVMTCGAPVGRRAPGCWSGLTLLGGASAAAGAGAHSGLDAPAVSSHAGGSPDDSSGLLRFLRVEFAGGGSSAGPALALHGVGSGTIVEFVQARESWGAGIEVRGGTVRIEHGVSTGARGPALSWSEDWTGTARHLYVRQGPEGGHGILGSRGGAGRALADLAQHFPRDAHRRRPVGHARGGQ